ncbi:MAG: hypothetical protein K2Y39_13655 [Candidatus Obscuribacterales bacterium]|nr:hypothetical protein [Candidatus Obscuribacterales bacterium]
MFFTLKSVDCYVIDADGYLPDFEFLDKVFEVLSNKAAVVAVTTNADAADRLLRSGFAVSVTVSQGPVETGLFQNVIRASLGTNWNPNQAVFLSAYPERIRAAHELLMGTVALPVKPGNVLLRDIFRSFPDVIIEDITELELLARGDLVGCGGEFVARGRGAFLINPAIRDPIFLAGEVPNFENIDCPVIVSGRYFRTADPRHTLHALTQRIIHSKEKPASQARVFAEILTDFGRFAAQRKGVKIDRIACIPGKPGEENRIGIFLNAMIDESVSHGLFPLTSQNVRPDLIRCIRDYGSLKHLNYEQRKAAVSGAFEIAEVVDGLNVMVVDDVYSTGATMNEVIKTLKEGGAKSIIPIAIGYHPLNMPGLALQDDDQMHCRQCDGVMVCRLNGTTGMPFYGCSKRTAKDRNHTTLEFKEAVEGKIQRLQERLMERDSEADSDLPF